MKKIVLLIIAIFTAYLVSAQKFGYVDSKYILSHVQAYADAQAEIDQMSMDWQKEIEQKYEAIEKMEKAYQAEKILLTSEMKKKREDELMEYIFQVCMCFCVRDLELINQRTVAICKRLC